LKCVSKTNRSQLETAIRVALEANSVEKMLAVMSNDNVVWDIGAFGEHKIFFQRSRGDLLAGMASIGTSPKSLDVIAQHFETQPYWAYLAYAHTARRAGNADRAFERLRPMLLNALSSTPNRDRTSLLGELAPILRAIRSLNSRASDELLTSQLLLSLSDLPEHLYKSSPLGANVSDLRWDVFLELMKIVTSIRTPAAEAAIKYANDQIAERYRESEFWPRTAKAVELVAEIGRELGEEERSLQVWWTELNKK
jgi:hypothetical protein